MANYDIEISATAQKQIRKLKEQEQIRILRAIQTLAKTPHPAGCRKLRGYQNVFRIREGDYRIIYRIEKNRLLIMILKVGHRKDVYR